MMPSYGNKTDMPTGSQAHGKSDSQPNMESGSQTDMLSGSQADLVRQLGRSAVSNQTDVVMWPQVGIVNSKKFVGQETSCENLGPFSNFQLLLKILFNSFQDFHRSNDYQNLSNSSLKVVKLFKENKITYLKTLNTINFIEFLFKINYSSDLKRFFIIVKLSKKFFLNYTQPKTSK